MYQLLHFRFIDSLVFILILHSRLFRSAIAARGDFTYLTLIAM